MAIVTRASAGVLVRAWWAALALAALLALGAAWVAARNPRFSSQAAALADAERLLPLMERRAGEVAGRLAEGTAGADPVLVFRLGQSGRLLEPRPLPAPVALRDRAERVATGEPSPAAGWLREARRLQELGRGKEAFEALDNALAAHEPGERALRARALRLKADWFAQAERWPEAEEVLEELAGYDPRELLDTTPVAFAGAYRLAEVLEERGELERAVAIRRELAAGLLAGRFPMPPDRIGYYLGELARGGEEGGAPGADELRATLVDFEMAGWLRDQLQRVGADAAALSLPEGHVALLTGSEGRVYRRADLHAALASSWSEMLPESKAFRVLSPEEPPTAAVLGAPRAPQGFGNGWRLVLAQPEAYSRPAEQRRAWVWTITGLLVAALFAVGFLGARALRRREELERVRAEFVAGVSHELRTPAASIGLLAENLAEGRVREPERQREYFEALQRDAARLQRLVADVLDASRLERGVFQVDPEPMDPASLLREVADEHRPRLRAGGVELDLVIDGPLPSAPLDADAVRRGLANLLDNALKYAADGGAVTLRAEAEGGALVVSVEDRGPGVPVGLREKVFEPYTRGPRGAGLAAGAGLGLALVKEMVEAHGGSVELADGAVGRGARFTLRFPLADDGAD